MSYTQEEVEILLASGDAQENESGSVTWAKGNQYHKKPGTFVVRPPQAAPLITQETASQMALTRRERRREAIEEGFAMTIGELADTPVPLTADEALAIYTAKLTEAAFDSNRKDFARLANLILEIIEAKPQKKIEVDQRRQSIHINTERLDLAGQSPAIQRLLEKRHE